VLDGSPPIAPPEPPSTLEGGAAAPVQDAFKTAIKLLLGLHTKSLAKFDGLCSEDDLRKVIEFLTDVVGAGTKVKAEAS
jgi:hypothetical protein